MTEPERMNAKRLRTKIKSLCELNRLYGCTMLPDGRYLFHACRDEIEKLTKRLRKVIR